MDTSPQQDDALARQPHRSKSEHIAVAADTTSGTVFARASMHYLAYNGVGMDVTGRHPSPPDVHFLAKDVPMIAPIGFSQHALYHPDLDELQESIVTQFFRQFRAEVLLCPLANRVYVLVDPDHLAAATATALRAAPLTNRALVPMTPADLDRCIASAQDAFAGIDGVSEDLAATLVEQGLFSFGDLARISLSDLMAVGDVTASQGRGIIAEARKRARSEGCPLDPIAGRRLPRRSSR